MNAIVRLARYSFLVVNDMTNESRITRDRLFSLDVLRGLDMILLTVAGPLVCALQKGWGCFPDGFMRQFAHGWECFTLWDIIMPLFIFMCGAAIPFALERRLKEGPSVFWRHVLGRVALLWVLGGLVQGRWTSFDPLQMSPFSNTLQAIAVGYLAVAGAMFFRSRALMVVVPVFMVAVYTVLLAYGGYGEFDNLAFRIDNAILRAILPDGSIWVAKPSHYTWFATSPMFAAMTFAGYHATRLLQTAWSQKRKTAALAAYGLVLLAVGLIGEIWIPCIKPIFTLSFTSQAMGWCVLSLSVLYVINDIWKVRRWFGIAIYFGRHALAAYFISHFFAPVLQAAAHLLCDGVAAHLPRSATSFVMALFEVAALVAAMEIWRRSKMARRKDKTYSPQGA